ncbi:MAG: hypothetical protein AABY22_27735 [Nanoarchaeota archaeon]
MNEQILEQPKQVKEQLNVMGVAIRAGISRNKIKYSEEELMKFAPTLTNKPILKDHNATVDNAVGLVTKSESSNGSLVQYQGWVKDDSNGILEKIKDGRIKEVSIGAIAGQLVRESDDSDIMIAQDLTGLELSLTPVPGIVGTSISSRMEKLHGKKPIFENINLFEQEKMWTCPECDEEMPMNKKEKHMTSHKKEEESITKSQYNDIVARLKDDGLLKNFKLSFEQWQSEVNKMEVKEDVKVLQEQINRMKIELESFKNKERENMLVEYKNLATEKKVKVRDVTQLSTEVLKLLVDELKNIEVDLTQGKVGMMREISTSNITETTKYGEYGQLLTEDGYIVERSEYGRWGLTIDPSRIKDEGVRWRLFKNPSPSFY